MDRTSLLQSLREKCGERDVVTDQADLEFFASDLYERGVTPCAVVRPRRVDQVQDIVRIARQQGCAIYLRGGGRSYSNAFLPQTEHALLVDSTGLDEIHKIDAENLFVTVGVGLTWARLDEALKPHGLRAVFWGPASGLNATIGGSMSQGTANNSSAKNGTSSDAVLSYEIVTGRGDLLTTGLDAQEQGLPNFRPYGPDLTGLFNADAGALGIKTAVTLKLEARPSALGGVSFAFESHANMVKGMRAATALGLSAAIIAMDADTADIRSGETGLKADLQKLLAIMRTAHNPLRGLVRGIKIALAGRRVFEQAKYTGHFLAEAPSEAVLRASERALRQAVASHGDEIPSAAISMMRADLFPALPTTHFDGRRMIPVHGILAWSQLRPFQQAYGDYIATKQAELDRHKIVIADIFSVLGQSAVLMEPVFYWPDSHTDFHVRTRPDFLKDAEISTHANEAGRALVEEVRAQVVDLLHAHGAAHLQIGKSYPYMRARSATNAALLQSLKDHFDPDGLLNPGALEFPNKGT